MSSGSPASVTAAEPSSFPRSRRSRRPVRIDPEPSCAIPQRDDSSKTPRQAIPTHQERWARPTLPTRSTRHPTRATTTLTPTATELPLYPEERLCEAPTADVVIQAVEGLRCSRLVDANGEVVKVFHDELTPVAKKVLRLLGVDLRAYGVNRKA